MSLRLRSFAFSLLAGFALASPALAHDGEGLAGGLASGFLHPLSGGDHLIAMVAVGLWGAQLGAPAIWLLPIAFPLIMAVGGVLGVMHIPLPAPEMMIALSAILLGAAVATRLRPPTVIAALVVSLFAIFHGHAHGAELPGATDPMAYGVGFVTATGFLHGCGIVIGAVSQWPLGARLIQGLGAMIALLGGYFLTLGSGGAG
ncbi:HupE/UreJ family protein [Methylosinus sp. H3A]|uniref:HupE/UreJ family protein n=1 Tax=Methylosinus sp. H3A TaxID=2785786 RepID=UPI0018C2A533|nr:HupE/UreJ family protein [Methylosinus sp. H3A]MBG0812462.1 HupE/UreJ family protein [Methylosinus sp. H3A]